MTLNATMKKNLPSPKKLKQTTKQRNGAIIERTNKHTHKTPPCKQTNKKRYIRFKSQYKLTKN